MTTPQASGYPAPAACSATRLSIPLFSLLLSFSSPVSPLLSSLFSLDLQDLTARRPSPRTDHSDALLERWSHPVSCRQSINKFKLTTAVARDALSFTFKFEEGNPPTLHELYSMHCIRSQSFATSPFSASTIPPGEDTRVAFSSAFSARNMSCVAACSAGMAHAREHASCTTCRGRILSY